MGGVLREPRVKSRHVAIIWGMYVAPAVRGRGAGRLLLDALIAHARNWDGVVMIELSVTETADSAMRVYRAAGFEPWGCEPRSLHWQGRYVAQTFLTLALDVEA
jgi:GNAT superfamily N-acetyltransferase